MTEITLRFEPSPQLADTIEALRGSFTAEEFLGYCLALGIYAVQEEATRTAQDRILAACVARDEGFNRYRQQHKIELKPFGTRPPIAPTRPATP